MWNILITTKTNPELKIFLYAAWFRPIKYTRIAEIEQRFFKTWPNMTIENLKMYLIEFISMQLGHMENKTKYGSNEVATIN